MGGVSRFDCYPSDFLNGIVGLTADQISAYTVVMMLIYDRGSPVEYIGRERELQVRSGMPKGRLDKAVAHLVKIGKLSLVGGCLTNHRTEQELEKINERILKNRENSEKGGIANKKKWSTNNKEINAPMEPTGYPDGYPKNSPIPSSFVPRPNKKEIITPVLPDPKHLPVSEKPACEKSQKRRGKIIYPESFEEFWKAYPIDNLMSKAEAFSRWKRLSDDDRQAAVKSLPAFRAYCTSHPDYRTIHASRYISQRRFDGFLESAAKIERAPQIFVKRDTPQWEAWCDYRRRMGMGDPPCANGGTGWYFPSDWPPSRKASEPVAAE